MIEGDGTGDFDSITGLACTDQQNVFDYAVELFDTQFPLIQFVDVDEMTEVHLEFIEQKEFEDIIELEGSLGNAKEFVDFDSKTGEMIFEPEEKHAGDYVIKMKLFDSEQEYEKSMFLKVQSPIGTETEAL